MKIAFISYEYPPDTATGGIATYVYQVARMMQQRGHHVEVFTSSPHREGVMIEDGVVVHRILYTTNTDRRDFATYAGKVFAQRHATIGFDVVEGPENDAHARGAIALVPDMPLVVKLHTPYFMVLELNYVPPSRNMKLRRMMGALRRGQLPKPFAVQEPYDPQLDPERIHTLDADEITTPSQALGDRLIETWGLPPEKVIHLPNPYIPTTELLTISPQTQTQTVSFLGRLEVRKGVLNLAKAIPLILQKHPQVTFQFVGEVCPSPTNPNVTMQQYLTRQLWRYRRSLKFTGAIPLQQIPSYLAQTDICVFPSRWENFPNVCLEAMAAARGIVGSHAGGMTQMLDDGKAGHLISPQKPEQIAAAVIDLLNNPTRRIEMGELARERVLSEYNLDRIGSLQEASYERAIARRQAAGSRTATALSAI
ncbi:MAG: glycosyltransferase family 4 protein [Leptolyngbya sp. BL-A-14]